VPGDEGLDVPVWPLLWPPLDGEEPGVWPEVDDEEDEGDDAEEVLVPPPAPGAEVLDPPELREAHPASEASTTAVVATVFTRGFIVLHLL
jgi:hypothetical protein